MHTEKANELDHCDAGIIRGSGHSEKASAHGRFDVECLDKNGKLKWKASIDNVVCTIGKDRLTRSQARFLA